jgi:hypothetical protein
MVWKTERKTEYKAGSKGKEMTRQGETNSTSNGSDGLMLDTLSAKILVMG